MANIGICNESVKYRVPGRSLEVVGIASYALLMKPQRTHPDIYQLRIVLRGISPLIWRRLLVRSDTTLRSASPHAVDSLRLV